MKYSWREKKKYFILGLFMEQSWRVTVDEKNRKRAGCIMIGMICLMYGFIGNNVFQSYVSEITNLRDVYVWIITGSIYTIVFIPYGIGIKRIYRDIKKMFFHLMFALGFNLSLAVRWEKRK